MTHISIPCRILPSLTGLSGSELNLYLILCDQQQRGVKSTRRSLQNVTGYSQLTVIRGTKALAERGLITKHMAERVDGCCLPTTYTVNPHTGEQK